MSAPSLMAIFQPQEWINDNAVDSGPDIEFDAGTALLAMSADQLRRVYQESRKLYGRDLDLVAEKAGLVMNAEGCADGHDGPFTVDIATDDIVKFFADLGTYKIDTMTDEDLVRHRETYGALAQGTGMRP